MILGYIYKITCNINNKCYIGQSTKKLGDRINQHKTRSTNILLRRAIEKYGWENFTAEILQNNIPIEKLNIKELMYTAIYNALAPDGYVLVAGNGKDKVYSPETIQKMKDWVRSPELKEKISIKAKGRKHSKETKKILSNYMIGKPAWNKGVPFSEETKVKMKESAKNKPPQSPETIEKRANALRGRESKLKGRPLSQKQKDNISNALKGHITTQETRDKISIANKNRPPMSQEQRDRRSKSSKGRIPSQETRDKISIANKGKPKANKGIPWTEEQLKKGRESRRRNKEQKKQDGEK